MIITFCGHAQFQRTDELEQKILSILEERVANKPAEMYLGGYGEFDSFAYHCCKKYKQSHPNISLVLVTPYLTINYQKNYLEPQKTAYDSILYPELETKPQRLAIIYRNKYMVEKADLVIAYVAHAWGGAYSTYKYAEKMGKKTFNLAPR